MVLERFLMKLFRPHKLAERDIGRVCHAIGTATSRCQQGRWIAMSAGIPEHDVYHLLGLMEQAQYIERDPGPFDQPWVRDRLIAWWCPGKHWSEIAKFYGTPK